MVPRLREADIKLVAIGIGTGERAQEFCEHTSFPQELLYADPENAAYDALELTSGIADTFFNPATPLAIAQRFAQPDRGGPLLGALSRWQPWSVNGGQILVAIAILV